MGGAASSVGASVTIADGRVSLSLAKKSAGPTFPCDYPMRVIRWTILDTLNHLVRSDVAASLGLIEELPPDSDAVIIFVSHSWWDRPDRGAAAPDFATGEHKNLKFNVIREGVRSLLAQEKLDPARICVWCDWFSIDQDDGEKKAAGVRSMIHYTTRCSYMLIPVPTPEVVNSDFEAGCDPDEYGAYYPEDVADYGSRGWCRVEYFMFGLFSEMRLGAESFDLKLFAAGSSGVLQQFKAVEFLGGDRGDMPSQGAFSFESDRRSIVELEDRMITSFGHAVIDNFAASGEATVDLGAKMLRDEHLPTLSAAINAGKFAGATTLSVNACPLITTLPDLRGMDSLRTLTCVNAHGLTMLPDLSTLPNLRIVKLENCNNLRELPQLPPGVEWEESHVPEHLWNASLGD